MHLCIYDTTEYVLAVPRLECCLGRVFVFALIPRGRCNGQRKCGSNKLLCLSLLALLQYLTPCQTRYISLERMQSHPQLDKVTDRARLKPWKIQDNGKRDLLRKWIEDDCNCKSSDGAHD